MSSVARTSSHPLRAVTVRVLRAAAAVAVVWLTGTTLTGCGSCGSATVTIHGDPSPTAPSPCTTPGGLNSYSCSCSCLSGTSQVFGPKGIQVCAPSANNGCTGGTNPTPTSESDDCHGRVQQTLQGMVRIVTNPEAMCTCTPSDTNRMLLQCNAPCTENAMPASATTWHNAANMPYTNAAGGTPVCANAALDPPLISGLAGAVFAPRSGCDVSGQVALVSHSDGLDCPADHPCTLPAGGTAGFVGTPCPGGTCNVDFGFNFTVSDFLVDVDCGILGFDFCDDLTVTDVTVTGEGTASMALSSAGAGSLGRGDVELATRSFQNGTPFSIQTTNPTPTNVVVDWGAKTCMVDQSLPDVTISDGSHSLTFDVIAHMSGPIVNQPPTARAGADQTLECTSFGGSEVKLDGSGSTDPDDNITWYTWRTGSHFDDPILSSSPDPVAETLQPLGTQAYSLRVFDAFSIMSESSTSVKVEDTTPPTIAGIALTPSCLWPPNHKYVRYRLGEEIAVDATDACDTAPVVRVVNVVSSQPDNGRGDGNSRSDILFGPGGFCVRSERSGGDKAGRTYTATISATDASGNETLRDVALHVPHSGGLDCPALDPSQFLSEQDVADLCSFPEPLVVNRAAPTGAPASGLTLGAGCSAAARGTPSAFLLALGAGVPLALRRRRRQS